jgi:hypothetical protein
MAITIISSPEKFTPAFNPVVFSLTSTNYMQPDFKFVADVYDGVGNLMASLKYQPQVVGTDPVVIDLSRILTELVSSDYLRLNSTVGSSIVTTSGAAISDYSVQFGEQYSNTVYANLSSYSGYAFNASMDYRRFAFYDDTAYVNKAFLTRFNRQVARKRDSVMISMLQSDTTAISGWGIFVSNTTGDVTYSGTINNPFTSLLVDNNRLLHLHVGFDHLYAQLGFSSTVYNQAAYYIITPPSGTPFRVDLYSQCERFPGIRLHFMNQLGGFDSFNFMLDTKVSQAVERKSFLRQATNKRTGYDSTTKRFEVLNRNYHTTSREKVKCISDWLTDVEAELLAELLSSPLVYMETDAAPYGGAGIVLMPMNIDTTNYDIKKARVDKLFNFELDLEYSLESTRQAI